MSEVQSVTPKLAKVKKNPFSSSSSPSRPFKPLQLQPPKGDTVKLFILSIYALSCKTRKGEIADHSDKIIYHILSGDTSSKFDSFMAELGLSWNFEEHLAPVNAVGCIRVMMEDVEALGECSATWLFDEVDVKSYVDGYEASSEEEKEEKEASSSESADSEKIDPPEFNAKGQPFKKENSPKRQKLE